MLKTICIKSNNNKINEYIIENIKNFKLNNIYLSVRNFSIYTNIILHYKGNDINEFNKFINKITTLLTNVIIKFYNNYIMKNLIDTNYFYFSDFDKIKILDYCKENCEEPHFNKKRKHVIKKLYKNYFLYNKKIILDGFVTFSIKEYTKLLDTIVDQSVNNYLIEKEYIEFIDLLKCYINSEPSQTEKIYLVYNQQNSTLYDKNGDTICIDNALKSKYLSDINFSNNDYCLNTLLTLLPKELIIYSNSNKDEFLTTLELIFGERISYVNSSIVDGLFRTNFMSTH